MPDGDHDHETGSFVVDNNGQSLLIHCTPWGVACNYSDGVEDKFSIRLKSGLHLRGLTESQAVTRLHDH